jgi:hypothetical protein
MHTVVTDPAAEVVTAEDDRVDVVVETGPVKSVIVVESRETRPYPCALANDRTTLSTPIGAVHVMLFVGPGVSLYTMDCVPVHLAAPFSGVPENWGALNVPTVACANPILNVLAKVIVTVLPFLDVDTKLMLVAGGDPMIVPAVFMTSRPALDLVGITLRSQPM